MKPHQCHRCERCFARLEHLKRHERSHTKEKPFRCSQCPQAFTRKDLLTRHNRLSHLPLDSRLRATGDPRPFPSLQPNSISTATDSSKETVVPYPADSSTPKVLELKKHQVASHIYPDSSLIPQISSRAIDDISNDLEVNISSQDPLHGSVNTFDPSSSFNADDFTTFLDSITLPSHPFSPSYQPLPCFSYDSLSPESYDQLQHQERILVTEQAPPEGAFGLSRFGSRLPSLQPEDIQSSNPTSKSRRPRFSEVTTQSRDRVASNLLTYSNVIREQFNLPSRHALTRFITGYVTGFHEHYPLLHLPTLSLESISVELFLSIAALGARYCREPAWSLDLFRVAKAIAFERLRRHENRPLPGDTLNRRRGTSGHVDHLLTTSLATQLTIERYPNDLNQIELIQALLLMIAVSTWSETTPPAREALSLRSILDSLVREEGLNDPSQPAESGRTWQSWIKRETIKRTKFLVFCFFNLHTIVFDIPPMILSTEIDLDLPCTEREWKAENAATWSKITEQNKAEPTFQEALRNLFQTESCESGRLACFSSLGGCILIHAIIQHIWLLQQNARLPPRRESALQLSEVASTQQALRRWRHRWERNQESSMDPLSPDGPLAFTSTALLRLAYIRINIDSGSVRSLSTWDPYQIAQSLIKSPPIQRSDRLTRAALHCAHALSIPIKLGVNFVAYTQVFYWSNQHALCSLECALLLSKWLETITAPNVQPPLAEEEERLLQFVVQMVEETEYYAPRETLLENNKCLSTIIVRVWAKLFRPDSVWEMVDLIGRSMTVYADLLENTHGI